MPIGIYFGVQKEIVSELLLRTFDIGELKDLKDKLNKKRFEDTCEFWQVLDYIISRLKVSEERIPDLFEGT